MCLGTCRTSVSHWKSSAFSSGAFHLHHSPKIPTSRLVLFLSLHFFFSFPENVRLNFRLHVKQLERNHDKSLGNHWAFLPIILLDSLQLLSSLNTALSYLMLVAWRIRGRDKRRGKKRKKNGRTMCKVRHQNRETKTTTLKAVLKLGQDFLLCQRE